MPYIPMAGSSMLPTFSPVILSWAFSTRGPAMPSVVSRRSPLTIRIARPWPPTFDRSTPSSAGWFLIRSFGSPTGTHQRCSPVFMSIAVTRL